MTNLVLALLCLLVAAPVMLVIAILVKLTSRGPILFTQERVGQDRRSVDASALRSTATGVDAGGHPAADPRGRNQGGRIFTIYKFRTMYVGSHGAQVWATPDDDRVTPLGRVLRKLHLDELPQLFNVLAGDMNLVGPRPEQPAIFEELAGKVPGYRLRQRVRPGITGWAQVNHHYDRTLDDVRTKVELDLEYLERRSALEDLKIAVRTVPAVLVGEHARGW